MEPWRVAIPMVWFVLAAAAGVYLSDKSEALFRIKGYRFAGAAAIAGAGLFLLARLTPPTLVTGLRPDDVIVKQATLDRDREARRSVADAYGKVEAAQGELKLCRTKEPASACPPEFQALESRMQQLAGAVAALAN